MTNQPSLTRRQFLRLAAAGAGSLLFSSCACPATPAATQISPTDTPTPPTVTPIPPTLEPPYQEAPMLAEQVAAGELPPVDERLPKNPRVVTPHEEIGQYGGTLHRIYPSGGSAMWEAAAWLEEKCTRWIISPGSDGAEYECVPNYISGWMVNEDNTAFTFVLREGLKWSDGAPFTTADVQFWYDEFFLGEHQILNRSFLMVGGELMQLEVLDELTYTFKFIQPFPRLPLLLAMWSFGSLGGPTCAGPAHYLSQFIPPFSDYAHSFINKITSLSGIAVDLDFDELLHYRGYVANPFSNDELPVLMAWQMTNPMGFDPFSLERNPYYFAVDTEGHQLPYVDGVRFDHASDRDELDLYVAQGKSDYQNSGTRIENLTFYWMNEMNGDYRTLLWTTLDSLAFGFNESIKDGALRELFANRDFVQALNLAIDRDEINRSVGANLNTPRQLCPPPHSQYYDPAWETRWTEYDPDTANTLLDGLGLAMGDDGFRTHPDGQPFTIHVTTEYGSYEAVPGKLVTYWQAVGIHCTSKSLRGIEYDSQRRNNELVCYPQSLPHGVEWPYPNRGAFAPAYCAWYWQNVLGQETEYTQIRPPNGHYIWELWEAAEHILTAPNAAAEEAGWWRYFELSKENRALVGIWGLQPAVYIVNNQVGNTVENGLHNSAFRGEKVIGPEQLFKRQA